MGWIVGQKIDSSIWRDGDNGPAARFRQTTNSTESRKWRNVEDVEVKSVRYVKHLKPSYFPLLKRYIKGMTGFIHKMGHHRNMPISRKKSLQHTILVSFFIKSEWPPASPDRNPLHFWHFYFRDAVINKVYTGRMGKVFETRNWKQKIRAVWGGCAMNKEEIHKASRQFIPSLKAVAEKNGYSVKKYMEEHSSRVKDGFLLF